MQVNTSVVCVVFIIRLLGMKIDVTGPYIRLKGKMQLDARQKSKLDMKEVQIILPLIIN